MIPEFPQFKKLDIADSDAVGAHTLHFPYYSDFNFTSLWCWDIQNKREISELNGNLVVKFTDYETNEPFLSYLGIKETLKTAIDLLDYSKSIGLPEELRLVPEISVHNLDQELLLNIKTDRDNFDYVYLISKFSTFEGRQYKDKRQEAERFMRQHPSHDFKITGLSDRGAQNAVRDIAEMWRTRSNSADDLSGGHEATAIERIFELSFVKDLFVGLVSTDGVPSAFTIDEIVNKIFAMGHFWKTANRVTGEYQYMARETATYLHSKEVVYWNWEQDLGIEDLRVTKSSYRPSDFLKKFTVQRKASDESMT
jgi:hypothetical protein